MTREQLQQLPKAGLIAIILRQIATTDQVIDNLVYYLYNLRRGDCDSRSGYRARLNLL